MFSEASDTLISANLAPPTNPEDPSLVLACLIALCVEILLYGMFLVLFFASLYILFYVKRHQNVVVNRMMAAASIMMFLLISGHVVCDILRATKAFTTNVFPPDIVYWDVHEKLQYAKAVMYFVLSLISDTIIVFRCWVLWKTTLVVVILPCLLCIATAAVGVGSIKLLMEIPHGKDCIMELGNWALAFFSLTLTTNGLCTFLIVSRIYWVMNNLQCVGQCACRYSLLFRIFIESAGIYTVALVTMIITYSLKSNAQYIALDALPPIIGIVFELIIALVALGLSTEFHSPDQCSRASGMKIEDKNAKLHVMRKTQS